MMEKKAYGSRELAKYEAGATLSLVQMVKAKCNECMCKYVDGRIDCAIPECPLYPRNPYGAMWKVRIKRPLTEKQALHRQKGIRKGPSRSDLAL